MPLATIANSSWSNRNLANDARYFKKIYTFYKKKKCNCEMYINIYVYTSACAKKKKQKKQAFKKKLCKSLAALSVPLLMSFVSSVILFFFWTFVCMQMKKKCDIV